MTKPYDPKKSVWAPDGEGGFMEGLLASDDGKKSVVMIGHEVSKHGHGIPKGLKEKQVLSNYRKRPSNPRLWSR